MCAKGTAKAGAGKGVRCWNGRQAGCYGPAGWCLSEVQVDAGAYGGEIHIAYQFVVAEGQLGDEQVY